MTFSDLAKSLNRSSEIETSLEKIKGKLPASYADIARILQFNIDDKSTDSGKNQREVFGHLLNQMVESGLIIEENGKYNLVGNVQKPKRGAKTKIAANSFKISSEIKGVVHVLKGETIFEPLDGDTQAVRMNDAMGMVDGNIVTAELADDFSAVSKIVDLHGNMEDDNALGKLSALSMGIPLKFPDDILSDTPSLNIPPVSPYRKDFRKKIPFITIDPVTAKDFDDAIYVRRATKGWTVMVAIADVSHYIKPGTKLAKEAHKRGNSTYLPDMTIPMLPEELSNGVCSLKPNEDRACMVCTMHIDKNGHITSKKFERGLMRSRMRLNYEQVQAAIEGDRKQLPRNGWGYIEKALEAYNARLKDKKRRGALEIDSPEQRVSIGKSRDLSLALEVGNEAHGIIEELMIAANVAAAELLQEKTDKTIKRVHGTPKLEVYNEYREQLEELGIRAPKSGDLKHRIIAIIQQIPHCQDPDLGYLLVTKMQDMATYSTEDLEHFGLALKHYTHETSPIRRATDWYVHCQLNEVFNLKGGYTLSQKMKDNMTKSADHFSKRERISQSAERECQRRYMALWVKKNIKELFQGTVTYVNGKQLWVKVDSENTSIKTPVKRDSLPQPISYYNNGDTVMLQPVKANPVTGIIEFKVVNAAEAESKNHVINPTMRPRHA